MPFMNEISEGKSTSKMNNKFRKKHTYNYNQNQNHFEEPYFRCHFGVINWNYNLFKITCIHFKFKRDFRILLS